MAKAMAEMVEKGGQITALNPQLRQLTAANSPHLPHCGSLDFPSLPWTDVVSAQRRGILGIRYLQVRRRTGSHLWIPLYFVGKSDLVEALLSRVPPGNPIHQSLQSIGAIHGAR
jgi:hypothetical protein